MALFKKSQAVSFILTVIVNAIVPYDTKLGTDTLNWISLFTFQKTLTEKILSFSYDRNST